ncbi:MAG: GAF domain-containing protein [Acetivibrionales bacterium]|jgi:transcriptional regulator with GAF, ATPase, and Fis domain|nr:GAF domain-containing protein [Clostridiaceae bacterium]
MEYGEILKQVEEQKKEKNLSGKMFRYSGLIMAVDYFSQKLNSDQIMNAAFDFVNELLTLDSSSLYCIRDDSYQLVREKGRSIGIKTINRSKKLNDLAVYHGGILTDKEAMLKYFDKETFANCNIAMIVPITVDGLLEGFMLIPEKVSGTFDEDDLIICEVLMNLCNSAMRNYESYNELRVINESLDEKIFNLFAINQSSKALLSQLDLDSLYGLAIDVFSELTQSSATGFVLFDEKSEKYVLRSHRFVLEYVESLDIVLEKHDDAVTDPNRIIIDTSDSSDIQYFCSIFKDGLSQLSPLKAQYIILLNKEDQILGFVTLGATITGTPYKKNIFELIESLASSTYIAISNAKHFRQVEEQKKIIQNKLDRLISLNNLVKNINSSMDVETLLDITMNTLNVSFFVDKCLIATYDSGKNLFVVRNNYGINENISVIEPTESWKRILRGRTALALDDEALVKYFGSNFRENLGDITGALIVPVYLDRAEVELLGLIVVFSFFDSLISDEENVLTLETIAGHIAPILHNLNVIEEQKLILMPDYAEMFKKDLEMEIKQAEEYGLELYIIKISSPGKFSFNHTHMAEKLRSRFKKVYPLAYNTVYVIVNKKEDTDKESILELLGSGDISVETEILGQDFGSLEEFLAQ